MSSHTWALRSDVVAVFRHLLSKVLCVCGKFLVNLPVSTCGICTRDNSGYVAIGGSFVSFGVCLFAGA